MSDTTPMILARVVPLTDPLDDDPVEAEGLRELGEEADHFLAGTPFCRSVRERYFGYGAAGVLGVFLFRIRHRDAEGPEWLWVIVGDLPPAILWSSWMTSPERALEAYVGSMREWTHAVASGAPVEGLIQVDVPATPDWADALRPRLNYIEASLLPECRARPSVRPFPA